MEKVPSFIFGLKYLAIIIVGYEISKLDSDTIKKYLNLFVKIVLTTGFIGIVINKSVYLNGVDRFMGLTASPASFAIYTSVTCVFLTESIRLKASALSVIYLLLAIYLLYMTHSRQPLIAILIYFFLRAPITIKIVFGIALTYLFTRVDIQFFRIFDLFINLQHLSFGGFDDLQDIRDGSLQSRIHYFTSGIDYLSENGRFWIGTGSIPFKIFIVCILLKLVSLLTTIYLCFWLILG